MKAILKIEELAQLIAAVIIIFYLPLELYWWIWLLLFFAPDISLAGYLLSPKAGGVLYNIVHHKGVAALVIGAGFLSGETGWQAAGLILWAHASFDRVFGYGFKYLDSFYHTHLGNTAREHQSIK